MTAYCFVGSPGFSNRTCILGAWPLGTASDGATYSLAFSPEYPIMVALPIQDNRYPSRFTLTITVVCSVYDFINGLWPFKPIRSENFTGEVPRSMESRASRVPGRRHIS